MINLKTAIITFINRLIGKRTYTKDRYNKLKFVGSLADVPENPNSRIYIVGDRDKQKWAVFACPNRCGRRVEVNLMKSRRPYWHLTLRKNKVTLSPSVIVEDCGAHFFLRNGMIEWASDSVME